MLDISKIAVIKKQFEEIEGFFKTLIH